MPHSLQPEQQHQGACPPCHGAVPDLPAVHAAPPPPSAAAQVAFTEVPKFAFDLTVWGGDLSVLPGLETWLQGLIKDAVLRPYVLPEQ